MCHSETQLSRNVSGVYGGEGMEASLNGVKTS